MVYKNRLTLQLWQVALAYLEDGDHLSNLSFKIRATYSHLSNILRTWMDNDIVIIKKDGKKKIIRLTNKGREIQESCKNLVKKLNLEVGKGGWQNGHNLQI